MRHQFFLSFNYKDKDALEMNSTKVFLHALDKTFCFVYYHE